MSMNKVVVILPFAKIEDADVTYKCKIKKECAKPFRLLRDFEDIVKRYGFKELSYVEDKANVSAMSRNFKELLGYSIKERNIVYLEVKLVLNSDNYYKVKEVKEVKYYRYIK